MLFCQMEMSQKHDKFMQYEIIKKKATAYVCMYVCIFHVCIFYLRLNY